MKVINLFSGSLIQARITLPYSIIVAIQLSSRLNLGKEFAETRTHRVDK